MTPRSEVTTEQNPTVRLVTDASPDGATRVVSAPGRPSYVHCTSPGPFRNPTDDRTAEEKNKELNLNLGQSLITPQNKTLLWIIRFLNNCLVSWWEHHFFRFWKSLPLTWKQSLTFTAWKIYFPIHKMILGRSTGIHPDASEEYHALTTVMWWGRFFPVSIQRMRFMLSEISVCNPAPSPTLLRRVEEISELPKLDRHPPVDQIDHCRTTGLYVHTASEPTEYTLLWIYGGAFLSGDTHGNLGPACHVARETNMDVFLASHRLVPEAQMADMVWDVCLAYRWLVQRRQSRGADPSKILLLGISSGGGLAVRCMQCVAEALRGQATLPDYLSVAVENLPLPKGTVTLGPFCDYTTPRGSLIHNAEHDLIVNQRVLEEGLPYLETNMGGSRREHSPVFRSFEGCPPICVVISEHEAIYDHALLMINNARAAGVPVTVGMWKYMCHVFMMLNHFVPEGEQAMEFACNWLREQQQ